MALTETEWRQLQATLKAQLISALCALPLSHLQNMLQQAEQISTTLGSVLYDALFQARNNVHDNAPSVYDYVDELFDTAWNYADQKYKQTYYGHNPLAEQNAVKLQCKHWYLTGRIHEASALLNAPTIQHVDPHVMHPFQPGFDEVCTVCDKREKEGNHGSDNPLDYSADAEPSLIQLTTLRALSEETTDVVTEDMINDWNIHNDHAE